MDQLFPGRREAGEQLAKHLRTYAERDDVIVLALPRGGVPVAYEVAEALHAPLDLMLVRKLGVPGQEELALGAIAVPNICVFNHDVVRMAGLSDAAVEAIAAVEQQELLRRNKLYRRGEPAAALKDKIVIIVDDGMATGANMHAAVSAVRQQQPLRVIVAVPVTSQQAYDVLKSQADEVVCLRTPKAFYSVGAFYREFSQISDQEVVTLLDQSRQWGHGSVHFEHPRASR